jgi:hypothetical protein
VSEKRAKEGRCEEKGVRNKERGERRKERGGEERSVMWGLRSPTPCGRTESCTLHILTDVLQVLTESEKRRHYSMISKRRYTKAKTPERQTAQID